MEVFIIIVLAVICFILLMKVLSLRSDAWKIERSFGKILSEDTNNLITLTAHDSRMRSLAGSINTELRHLREEKNKYYHGNVELSNAITNISHDLRTPLTAIIGYLDMMGKTDSIEKIKGYLPIITKRAESMKQLTEELFSYSIDYSNADAEVEREELVLNQVLEDSILGYYSVLSEKGMKLEVDITENKIIRTLNRTYMSRIFSNLLNNAVKYSDGDLKICLKDDGDIIFSNSAASLKGIDAEQLFDRFYTVEAARSSTGLGLSIVKLLVERQGGEILSNLAEGRLTITISFKS